MNGPLAPAPPSEDPPPELVAPALTLFERGDFRRAAALASALATHPDPPVQAAARALLARLAPDPWAFRLGLLALALLALVTGIYVP